MSMWGNWGFGSKNGQSPGKENAQLAPGKLCTAPVITREVETVAEAPPEGSVVAKAPSASAPLLGAPAPQQQPQASSRPPPKADSAQASSRPPLKAGPPPKKDSAEVPEWLIAKVDDYITDHFYALEAKIQRLEAQMSETVLKVHDQQPKIEDVLNHLKTLIEVQFEEGKKGRARDEENTLLGETFAELRQEVNEALGQKMDELRDSVTGLANSLQKREDNIMSTVKSMMAERDDANYTFETELSSVKQSFTSLRMEFKKNGKGQDFKNTSTSVFLLKAIDMKPDERKQVLSKLSEHEEKLRGALTKADHDLKSHENQLHAES